MRNLLSDQGLRTPLARHCGARQSGRISPAAPPVANRVVEGDEGHGGSALSQKGIGLRPGKHTRVAAQRHARRRADRVGEA
jgi:hypothetical protein